MFCHATVRARRARLPRLVVPLTVVMVCVVLAGCSSASAVANASAQARAKISAKASLQAGRQPDVLTVSNQSASGKTISVAKLVLSQDPTMSPGAGTTEGFVVLATDVGGTPGQTVGYTPVPVGTSSNLTITSNTKLTGGSYWVLVVDGTTPPGVIAPTSEVKTRITVTVTG